MLCELGIDAIHRAMTACYCGVNYVNPIRFDCMESVLKIEPERYGDNRGFFAETYSRARYSELGIRHEFV